MPIKRVVGANFEFDWNGDAVLYTVLEATRRAINDTTDAAYAIAFEHPAWDNDTYQTEEALYRKPAEIELYGSSVDPQPHVWGEWGVEDRPRDEGVIFKPSPRYRAKFESAGKGMVPEAGLLTTVDVALFLEFGTVNMEPRPWLYPAWDATKHMMAPLVRAYFEEIGASGTPTAIRSPLGRFLPHL